jgi:hypothetical protein
MTVQPQANSKKRTKYRPMERPDGVIVLHRPYRPSTSSLSEAPKFEKHLPTFTVVPAIKVKPRQDGTINKGEQEFAYIGAHVTAIGRGGYNDVCYGRKELGNVGQLRENGHGTPMQRFLGEMGPWSAFELRDS